ncbi:MAG TPA: L-fucose mutarotase [Verrucomicrobiae bacterium]|jgi:L-fucose mutarotase|nr:L-fucose mutarotase [Verrucomicrobiae bacterium]
MLKGIPNILPPELLKILMEMGHGDEIVIADGNFPAASHAQRLVRCDGLGVPQLLDAVLQLFPLDNFVKQPAALMAVVPGDHYTPDIWPVYKKLIQKHESQFVDFEMMERQAFYERAKKAYAIVATGEMARYANLILKKGLIT